MRTGTKQMDDLTLRSIIDQKIKDGSGGSVGTAEGELSVERQETFDYYMGEPFGNEIDGQSDIVTREVLETIEWAMPSLMRVFAASDKVVEFDPTSEKDEPAAEQQTDYINYIFLKQNNGYEIIHNWIKSGLLYPAAYVKVWWDETEETTTEKLQGLTEEEAAFIANQPDTEITAHELREDGYYIEAIVTDKVGRAVVQTVPEEELIIDANLESISLEKASFVAHRTRKVHSDLVGLGYNEQDLIQIGSQETGTFNSERVNRRFRTDETDYYGDENEIDKSMQVYWVDEVYLRVDYDGDGIAELRRIVKIADKIFENEPINSIPFVAWSSILMPHKHLGIAYAELAKDIQRIKSVMTREMLNNLHRTNNPRTVVGEGVNLDDLLNNRANGIVRTENMGDLSIEPTQSVIANVIPALNLLDQMKEVRTGVSRSTMGLDADVLAKSTKGAFLGAMEQANQRLELVARNFAEMGLKSLFLKLHQLVLTHQDKDDVVKLRNKWVTVDPREWKERKDMTVHVGIGNGNKEQQLQSLAGIMDVQRQMLEGGLGGVTVTPKNLYNTVTKMVELAGFRNSSKYFQNPEESQPKEPKPDPQQEFLKLQAQIEQQKLQLEQMKAQMKDKTDNRKIDAAIAKDMTELELKYATNIPGAVV